MSDNIFVDTKILLYSRDASEPEKQTLASARLAELWNKRNGRLCVQVLKEYFVNATRKLDSGFSPEEAWDDIEALSAWNPLPIDMAILTRTFAAQRRYQLSWRDSMIIAAAETAGAPAFSARTCRTVPPTSASPWKTRLLSRTAKGKSFSVSTALS